MAGNQAAFAAAVLRGIGAPVTNRNIAGFIGWAKAEGGDNWQRNNPLNTTEGLGATGTINSAGVKAYGNPGAGIRATVVTLKNGNYGGIIHAFRANNPLGMPLGELNTWGTGSLALQTIRSTLGQHFNVPQGSGGSNPIGGGGGFGVMPSGSRTVRTTQRVFNAPAYQAAKANAIAGQYLANQTEASNPYGPLQAKIPGLSSSQSVNPLLTSGELRTTVPNPSAFTKAQTTLETLTGTHLNQHPLAQIGMANQAVNDATRAGAGRDAVKLLGMIRSVLGAQYNQGNHNAVDEHRGQIRAQGTDCSGLISWLMGPNGLGIWHTSLATPQIADAPGLQKGRGSVITIYNNKQAGNAGHVFIQIGNQYFASEGGVGVRRLPMSEVHMYLTQGSDGGTYQALHPRGL